MGTSLASNIMENIQVVVQRDCVNAADKNPVSGVNCRTSLLGAHSRKTNYGLCKILPGPVCHSTARCILVLVIFVMCII